MKDPAIHIHLSSLVSILEELDIPKPKDLSMMILRKASQRAIKNRYLVSGNSKVIKAVERIKQTNTNTGISPDRFNFLLTAERKSLKHRNITQILPGSTHYQMLREITSLCNEFINNFEFSNSELGATKYITIGLNFMKRGGQFALNKFKYYNDKISTTYECEYALEHDDNPEATAFFYEAWKTAMEENANVQRQLVKPEDKVAMLYGRLDADENNADYSDWIEAQFDQLAFLNTIPNLNQLYGDKAANRYYAYIETVTLEKPVKHADTDYKVDFMATYKNNLTYQQE